MSARENPGSSTLRAARQLLLVAGLSLGASPAVAQEAHAGPLSVPPRQWAVDATSNEVKAIHYTGSYLRYREHVVNAKGDETRDVIESRDGSVARKIFIDGRPLTAEEDAAEHVRLQGMIDSPAAFAKHMKNDATGKKTASELMAMIPDAMLFSYAPGQPQRPRPAGDGTAPEVVLDFKPNPNWTAPTITSSGLTSLEGRMWINPRTRCIGRLEAHVFQQINVGLGILGHVYPGGELALEQVNLADRRLIFTRFIEHITARALLVKQFKENSDVTAGNYEFVESMSYADAIRKLLATPLPTR